jgi:hypothetical protein
VHLKHTSVQRTSMRNIPVCSVRVCVRHTWYESEVYGVGGEGGGGYQADWWVMNEV